MTFRGVTGLIAARRGRSVRSVRDANGGHRAVCPAARPRAVPNPVASPVLRSATLRRVGNIGPGELIIIAIILFPIGGALLAGPFALGYFWGKSKGRREAMLEQFSRGGPPPGA